MLKIYYILRLLTSLTWLKFIRVVWFKAQANVHYCLSCLKKMTLASKKGKID